MRPRVVMFVVLLVMLVMFVGANPPLTMATNDDICWITATGPGVDCADNAFAITTSADNTLGAFIFTVNPDAWDDPGTMNVGDEDAILAVTLMFDKEVLTNVDCRVANTSQIDSRTSPDLATRNVPIDKMGQQASEENPLHTRARDISPPDQVLYTLAETSPNPSRDQAHFANSGWRQVLRL